MSSARQDWATPQRFFDRLHAEFQFTVDVCATAENAKCRRFFTPEVDGLRQDWSGERVWMNPPYGRLIKEWTRKARTAQLAVGLLPSRTDTGWWHDDVQGKAEVRFVRGRLRFEGAKWSAPFPSVVAIWRR